LSDEVRTRKRRSDGVRGGKRRSWKRCRIWWQLMMVQCPTSTAVDGCFENFNGDDGRKKKNWIVSSFCWCFKILIWAVDIFLPHVEIVIAIYSLNGEDLDSTISAICQCFFDLETYLFKRRIYHRRDYKVESLPAHSCFVALFKTVQGRLSTVYSSNCATTHCTHK